MNHQVGLHKHLGIEIHKFKGIFMSSFLLHSPEFLSVFWKFLAKRQTAFSLCLYIWHSCVVSGLNLISNFGKIWAVSLASKSKELERDYHRFEGLIDTLWLIVYKRVSKMCSLTLLMSLQKFSFGTFGLSVGFGFSALIIRSRVGRFHIGSEGITPKCWFLHTVNISILKIIYVIRRYEMSLI